MMRKLILFLLFSVITYAQVPQGMSHRGIAYNTSGVVLQNTNVAIRVRILEGSASGTIVYEEKHNKTTNGTGQYNFNIGQGTQQGTNTFSSINWGVTTKFLQIAIDPNNGTNYSVVGTSQLMSVPYALYSENVNSSNSIVAVKSLCELRNYDFNKSNTVFVKGYREPGDGGGGFFYWKAGNNQNDDDGIIIKPNNSDAGRWLRQIDEMINIKFYGSFGVFQDGDGIKIQKAIDYANSIGGGIIYLPKGNYKIYNSLILKNGVSIKGDGIAATILTAGYTDNDPMSGTDTNSCYIPIQNISSFNNGYMITIDSGRVMINISDITIAGNTNPSNQIRTKGAIYIGSTLNGIDGGFWRSTIKNVNIYNFNGVGVHLDGGGPDNNYKIPNQFLVFENVHIIRQKENTHSLQITGQQGQLTFLNCLFNGITIGDTSNNNPFEVLKGFNVAISNKGYVTPAVISFINSTFENSEYGVILSAAESVTFDNCWFETLDNAVTIRSNNGFPSRSINVINSRFANAAGFGSLNVTNLNIYNGIPQGRCITVDESSANIHNNTIVVSDISDSNLGTVRDPFVKKFLASSSNIGIQSSGNTFSSSKLNKTSGVTCQTTTVSNQMIDLKCNSILLSIPTSQTIKTINSTTLTGERIVIKVNTPSTTFNNTGNIRLGTSNSLIVTSGKTLEFIKLDTLSGSNIEIYQLLSIY